MAAHMQHTLSSWHLSSPLNIFICWNIIQIIFATRMNPYETYSDLYTRGTQSYLEEDWQGCINYMLSALDDYSFYRSSIIYCRTHCRDDNDSPMLPVETKFEEIDFYAQTVRYTLCVLKCRQTRLALRPNEAVDPKIENDFENKIPYEYLQLCYFKIGNIQQAASAAYTFLSWNPNSEVMQYNFKYYSNLENIQLDKVKNLETRTFQELYLMGNEAYNSKKYHEVMHYFETALEEYFVAEDECRLLCEGPFERNSFQDFIVSVANHFAFSLKCKQNCHLKLSFMYGEQYQNYLPSHYHYLQFAYFKVGEIKKACRAVATYLLFHGDDNTMKRNREFYLSLEGVKEEDFTPVEEAVTYFKRDKAEKELLNYIKENYKFDPQDFELKEEEKIETATSSSTEMSKRGPKATKTKEKMIKKKENEITVLMGEKELNGSRRFVADGFATLEECDHLLYLAQVAAVNGDGYNGKKSPHTQHERFEGLTMGRAAILAKLGLVEVEKTKLLLDVSEKGRNFVQKYFKLDGDLLFTYTHLVCRTALKGSTVERLDLSHPVHADNCLLQKDGSCLKEKPAFTYRDYSAVIYLNEDFKGGEFIFAKDKDSIQAVVKPKCGRLVGFSAGYENLHGVQAITSGRRCALAMWYTLDHSYREKEREIAQDIIEDILKEKAQIDLLPIQRDLNIVSVCNFKEYLLYGETDFADTRPQRCSKIKPMA